MFLDSNPLPIPNGMKDRLSLTHLGRWLGIPGGSGPATPPWLPSSKNVTTVISSIESGSRLFGVS
jgi:hypothetical protein